MKILKLSAYYDPEQVASSHLTKDLETAWVKAGHTIENFVPMPTRGISDEVRTAYRNNKYEERENGKIIIHRFSLFREGKNPLLRAIRYGLCNLIQYWKGIHAENVDVIFGSSTPPTAGVLYALVAKRLSRKYGRKVHFIYNLQDIFPDSLVHTGLAKRDSILWKIGRKVENFTYRNADKIVVLSEDFRKNIMEKGVPAEKIELIYNWINEEAVFAVPREENPLFDRYQIPRDKFYVAYSGNIGHTQNMDMLLDVAKSLSDHPDIGFIIVGDGAHKEHVEKRVTEEEISNVYLLPYQSYEIISQVFSLGDVGLLISKGGVGNNSVPSKTWSYFSAQRPVLASFDLDSELCDLIQREQAGVCVAPDNAEALRQAILRLADDGASLQPVGQRARDYIQKNLTAKSATDKWLDVLYRVCVQ